MLNFPGASVSSNYLLDHLTNIDAIEAKLVEKRYDHLICDLPFPEQLKERVTTGFPLLKSTYLQGSEFCDEAADYEHLIINNLQTSLDDLSLPVCFKNRKGEYLACNRSFSKLTGLTSEELAGKTVSHLLPNYNLDKLEETDRKVFRDQREHLYEASFPDCSGTMREMLVRKQRINNGETQVCMMFDVSEINETKRLLEKEQLRLRATADLSTDLIFFKDLDGCFIGCNKQFESFVGCSEKEILGKKDEQLFEFQQALMCKAQDQDVIANNKIYHGEEYLTYSNGQRHFIDMKKVPLQGKDGQVQGLIGIGRDITAHHLLQKRLKVTNAVFENNKEGLLVTDQAGVIISVNKACCDTSGYAADELLDININNFPSNQHENIEKSLKEKNSWQGEIIYFTKSGETHFAWVDVYIVEHPEEGISNRIYSYTDLSRTRDFEEKIQFLAKHDSLTGLFNRIAFFNRLEDSISRANYQETIMAVLLVDINRLQEVNDQYGHNAGDEVLKEIANRLKSCIFEKETVARFSDHTFAVIINELENEQEVAIIAQKIIALFNADFVVGNSAISLSAAIGISIFPDDGIDNNALLNNASKALQRARRDISVPYHFYTAELTRQSNQQLALESELKQALQLDQFELYYLPQYDLNSRQIVAMETVLCWDHPQQGILQEDDFLILVEKSGLLIPIGLEIISKAALQAVNWYKSGIKFGRIAINLSKEQLGNINFVGELQAILQNVNCSNQWLEFIIDKPVLRDSSINIQSNLSNISKMGIAITVTNFGIASEVIDFINHRGVEKVKVPRHYIKNDSAALASEAVIKSVDVFARTLGLSVVGDDIDNSQQEDMSSQRASLEEKAMKSSEATFYLRCNKRK